MRCLSFVHLGENAFICMNKILVVQLCSSECVCSSSVKTVVRKMELKDESNVDDVTNERYV